MKIEIRHRPSYALAVVDLDEQETVIAEAGAMVSKDTHVDMETSTNTGSGTKSMLGGLMSGLKRAVAGESFFMNRFTAQGGPGHVTFAPTFPGDIEVYELSAGSLILQSTAFLCSGSRVTTDAKWGGAKSFFGGEGLIMLRATGTGPVVFNAFGGIKVVEVDGAFTLDTGHIVAFEDTLQFTVSRFGGGWKSFIFGGEGLVCDFTGRGRLWIQTRNPNEFGALVGSKLPPRS
jgi:uncharacterized protein (TIGR00266 family)